MNEARIDPAAVAVLFNDPAGPVADILLDAAGRVAETAQVTAPVSSRGSRYSPPGNLKRGTGADDEVSADADGLYARVHTPSYPYNFVKGRTRNATRWGPGQPISYYGFRNVDKPFLTEALNSASTGSLFGPAPGLF